LREERWGCWADGLELVLVDGGGLGEGGWGGWIS